MDLKQFNSSPNLEGKTTWPGGPALVHHNVTLLECATPAILDEALICQSGDVETLLMNFEAAPRWQLVRAQFAFWDPHEQTTDKLKHDNTCKLKWDML